MNSPGPLPELRWLPKDSFVVDHHYQRHTNSERSQKVIAKIAKNFLWARFQPPTVTPGPKGKYLIIDGQHRIAAAIRREDIETIPVYVVPDLTLEEQAGNFVAINRDRVGLNPLAMHHAMVTMGDPEALKIKEVCDEADVAIARQPAPNGNTKPRETAALGAIKQGLIKYDEASVIAALMIIPDAYKVAPGMMRSRTLKALMKFFHERGVQSVEREALKFVLKEAAPPVLEEEAAARARVEGGTAHDALVADLNRLYEFALTELPRRGMPEDNLPDHSATRRPVPPRRESPSTFVRPERRDTPKPRKSEPQITGEVVDGVAVKRYEPGTAAGFGFDGTGLFD